jgi:hypothetical protein
MRELLTRIIKWNGVHLFGHLMLHTLSGGFVLVSIRLTERLGFYLWDAQHGEPMFFGLVPIKYFFHAMDAAVLIVLGLYIVSMLVKSLMHDLRN